MTDTYENSIASMDAQLAIFEAFGTLHQHIETLSDSFNFINFKNESQADAEFISKFYSIVKNMEQISIKTRTCFEQICKFHGIDLN